jgi:hypothetical protein
MTALRQKCFKRRANLIVGHYVFGTANEFKKEKSLFLKISVLYNYFF